MENDGKNNPEVTGIEKESFDTAPFKRIINSPIGSIAIKQGEWIILSFRGKTITICFPKRITLNDGNVVSAVSIKEHLLDLRNHNCPICSLCLDVSLISRKSPFLCCFCQLFRQSSSSNYDSLICDAVSGGCISALAEGTGEYPLDESCLYSQIFLDENGRYCVIKEKARLSDKIPPFFTGYEKESAYRHLAKRYDFHQDSSKYDLFSEQMALLMKGLEAAEFRIKQEKARQNYGRGKVKKNKFDIAIDGIYFVGLTDTFKSAAVWLADLLSQRMNETVEVFRVKYSNGKNNRQRVYMRER